MYVLKDHFYGLSSESPQERIQSASSLIAELVAVNKKEEWDYTLNRLIKGLASTRQTARLGFSVALAELLRELLKRKDHELNIRSYLEEVMKNTEVSSSMKGKEERALLLGRLFGLQVLINQELVSDEELAPLEYLCLLADSLLGLSISKSWLRETAIFTLCRLLETAKARLESEVIFKYVLQKVNDVGLNLTTEGVALYLSIPRRQRSIIASKIQNMKSGWKLGDPLAKGNLPLLARVLKDVGEVDDPEEPEERNNKIGQRHKQKGSWMPRVHFVWDMIVSDYIHQGAKKSDKLDSEKKPNKRRKISSSYKGEDDVSVTLSEFWKVVVDETFFSEKSSHERKFSGFQIFMKFLESLRDSDIACLFSPNLMKCLINQASKNERFLNKMATRTLDTLVSVAEMDFRKAPIIFASVIDESKGGTWKFDMITKSKCSDRLLSSLCAGNGDDEYRVESLNKITDILLDMLSECLLRKHKEATMGNEEDTPKTDSKVKWIMDKILTLFRNGRKISQENHHWKEKIVKLLIENAFFSSNGSQGLTDYLRKLFQDRLNSVISDCIGGGRNRQLNILPYCIKELKKFERSSSHELLVELDDDLNSVKNRVYHTLKSLKTSIESTKNEESFEKRKLECFQTLFCIALLELYKNDEEAVTVIEELTSCYNSTFGSSTDVEDKDTSITFTEIVLSFSSRQSALFKKLAFIVWETFVCSLDCNGKVVLNEESLTLLFDVLEGKENKEGKRRLFEDNDDEPEDNEIEDEDDPEGDDEDEEVDEVEVDDDLDAEELEIEHENDDQEKSLDKNASDSEGKKESTEEGDDKMVEVDRQTNLKLAEALGIPTKNSGEVKFDELDSYGNEDDSEYESDSMDDDQMMAIDSHLSRIFKERQDTLSSVLTGSKRKAQVQEAKDQVVFLKNRVLDLLETFCTLQEHSHFNLSMIAPLLILIDLTLDKNIGMKAHKLLKNKVSRTKISMDEVRLYYPSFDDQAKYKTSLLQLLEWLHHEAATKKSNQAHMNACGQASILVSKNLVGLDDSYLPKIIDVYSESIKNWATNSKNKMQASIFFSFVNWLSSRRSK